MRPEKKFASAVPGSLQRAIRIAAWQDENDTDPAGDRRKRSPAGDQFLSIFIVEMKGSFLAISQLGSYLEMVHPLLVEGNIGAK